MRQKSVARGVFHLTHEHIVSGSGAHVTLADGRVVLDCTAGLGVLNVGHAHPRVVQAVCTQAERFTHSCYHVFGYEGYEAVCARLGEAVFGTGATAPDTRAMLVNSGAEAVENAVKVARAFTGRPAVIALDHNFHGRTLLATTLTSAVQPFKQGIGPYAPEVYRSHYAYCLRCPLNLHYPDCGVACAHSLEQVFARGVRPEDVACVVAEPVAGQAGNITVPPEFFPIIRRICDDHGILLVADEVQTGVCRTGAFTSMAEQGVVPDVVCLAKSIAGGLPLGAVVGRAEVMDALDPGGLGGTFSGNPLACAAALAVLDVVEDEGLAERSRTLGQMAIRLLREELAELPGGVHAEVRGAGLMVGVELYHEGNKGDAGGVVTAEGLGRAAMRHALEHPVQGAPRPLAGLASIGCGSAGHILRTLAPLVTDEADLRAGMRHLGASIRAVCLRNGTNGV